jgi:LuxR family transcriptional regulator
MQNNGANMGLTSATAEKHLRFARKALNVDTTAQAVLKAALQNPMYASHASCVKTAFSRENSVK